MTPERYARLTKLFLEVSELPVEKRSAFLEKACPDDPSLRSELEALLSADASGFLDRLNDESEFLPERIGGYKILRVLGEGGMGIVYLAEQEKPRRHVALKVVRTGLLSGGLLKRFEYETHALGRLKHPGIAQIFEAGTATTDSGPQPFFAMEYVEGQSLSEYVKANHFGTRERIELMIAICEAVQHAHQNGVIHRDLKPANILVDEAGQPKILDFGVARATDADVHATTMRTGIGDLVGTLRYMSPEQAAGDTRDLDTRSDVYALGVICYELLTEHPPYDLRDKMIHEAVRVIREDDPTPLSSYSKRLKGDLETLVAKALEKNKLQRYQTASEFVVDMRSFLADEPLPIARPPGAMYRVRKAVRRNKVLVSGILGMTATLLAGLATTTWQWKEAQAAEARTVALLEQVRELSNVFVFDVLNGIIALPGSRPVVELVIGTGLRYIDVMASDNSDDQSLVQDLARAYVNLGDSQGYPAFPNIGDAKGALESYHKALTLLEPLRDQIAADPILGQRLSLVLERIGDMELAAGKPFYATAHFRDSLAVSTALLKTDPNNMDYIRALSTGHQRIGNVFLDLQQFDKALREYRGYLELCETRLRVQPESAEARSDWALGHLKIATVLEQLGRLDEALTGYQKMHDTFQELYEENPNDISFVSGLANAADRIGNILVFKKEYDKAKPRYQESLTLREQLAKADPKDVSAQRYLTVSYKKLGDVAWYEFAANPEQGDAHLQESLDWYLRTVPIAEALVKADPTSVEYAHGLATSLEEIGVILAAMPGRFADAESFLDRSHSIRADQHQKHPELPGPQRNLAGLHYKVGEYHLQAAKRKDASSDQRISEWCQARAAYGRGRELLLDLRDRNVLSAFGERYLAACERGFAECKEALAELGSDGKGACEGKLVPSGHHGE